MGIVWASDLGLGEASASIQRVALQATEGLSANQGAAPCVVLKDDPSDLRLAAPVGPGEALWIGLVLPAGTEFLSATAGESPLNMDVKASDASGTRFLRSVPFGAGACVTSADVSVGGHDASAHMCIELSNLEEFNRRFGVALVLSPSSASYGGWRLP